MKQQDQAEQSTTYNPFKHQQQQLQPSNDLRHALPPDNNSNKPKKKTTIGWDRIRENVGDFHHVETFSESNSSIITTTTTTIASTPSSLRSNTPKSGYTTTPTPHKKQHNLNPFLLRGHHHHDANHDGRYLSLANTTLVAAQAAGMTHFNRQFRAGAALHNKNGGIYATSTAVQQDIYKLERNLTKLLLVSTTSLGDGIVPPLPEQQQSMSLNSNSGKKSVFQRQSVVDLFNPSSLTIEGHNDEVHIAEGGRNGTRISGIMTSIMESIVKHKAATRLPLTGEILAVLSEPFDKLHLIESDCVQALDLFDYILDRFKLLDASEHFERILFCCRLLSAGDMKSKKRALDILNSLFELCKETPDYLPSTPTAYHSIVYTLTDALSQVHHHHNDENHDMIIRESHPIQDHVTMDQQYIRNGIMAILDNLANGKLIPILGPDWKSYYADKIPPGSVTQLCVVEGLLKSILMSMHDKAEVTEGTRDQIILQDLLPRYWLEPEIDARPAYFKILFLLTELACDTFLMGNMADLKNKTSVVSLLLPLVVDKLSPTKLQDYLTQQNTNETQNKVAYNVISMLLCLLSICSLEEPQEQPSSVYSSPNLSPRPSMPDFSEGGSLSPQGIISSFDTATNKNLMTLKGYMEEFWNTGYKEIILTAIESMHQDISGESAARCFQNLVFHLDPTIGEEIVKRTLPSLFQQLVDTYPPAIPAFCQMLFEVSKKFRAIFFKPVVSCVASDDENKVTHQLEVITCLRRYLSGVQFWMQDAEMINVLLLSDVGGQKQQQREGMPPRSQQTPQLKVNDVPSPTQWGTTTLGQCAIAAEFMWVVKELREKQKYPDHNMEQDEIAKKFLIDLERRLAIFLTAKEKMSFVPLPLRIILCNIFIDIRFFCNTTHRPGWLSRVIDWACQPIVSTPEHVFHHVLPIIHPDVESKMPVLHIGHINDAVIMFERIHCVYLNVEELLQLETNDDYGISTKPQQHSEQVPPRRQRHELVHSMYPINRSTAQSLDLNPHVEDIEGPALKLAKYRFEHMEKINQDAFGSVFSLLAAVFTTLSLQEFGRLVKPLWELHTDDRKPQSYIPAAFLLMECGEKIPKVMIEVTTHDFYSGDPLRRLAVIQKHSSLSAFKFNVLGQEYIPVSSRRRPFRGDGGAFSTPFVPTDLGSNQFTLDEPHWMAKLKNTSNFPIELKRQIQELGWDDDENVDEYEALKKVLTPLTLLPSLFLEEEDERMKEVNENMAPVRHHGKPINISKIIIRRKRATTIHSLTVSFLSMVDLLNDDYGGASNSLRELLEYFLRDDPALFLRSFLNDLGKYKLDRHKDLLTRLRYLISMQHKLPPSFTHVLFNYLAGMLKWLARENKKEGLILMTLIHPLLAELTLSTNDLSIRDLRKNKIEHLLVSTGRFWFTHEQPAVMFPRSLSDSNHETPFTVLDIRPEVFSVAMLRISHIQFLTNYLVRYPREVYAVKKTLQDYEPTPVPGNDHHTKGNMEEAHYPDITKRKRRETNTYLYSDETALKQMMDEDEIKPTREPSQQKLDTSTLAALRARIWLRFADNLLNGLNKNYNDRDELERILQGVNAIITEHDRDFGIIGQALVLYTRVVTRFKRLFVSNRGYATFLSSLFKVFCEVDSFPQVRSAITFAWCRFYAVHEESFVFQMLGTLVPTILGAYTKSTDIGSWMLDNLFILIQAMHDPPHLGATSDILGLQLQVELDDHERSIQERIDAASNPMIIPLSTAILKPLARSVTVPIAPLDVNNYNNKSFELQNFIKLFLTIIAYDPGSLRAEQFVKLFRHMIPRFEKLAILRDLVDEGISALVDVFAKFTKNTKPMFTTTTITPQTNANGYQGVIGGGGGFDNGVNIGSAAANNARTESAQHAYGKQWQQNDRLTVKKEFVLLVQQHLKHGGTLGEVAHVKMAQIIRIVMQNYGSIKGYICPTDWIKNYLVDSFHSMTENRNYTKSYKKVLNLIFSQYRVLWKTIDAADLYDGLAIVLEEGKGQPMYVNDIANVINEKFVNFGLTAATRHNWENDAKAHIRYCNALVRLIIAIMENSTQDVLGEIEQQNHTPGLIGNIIIPICLQYNLQWDYSNMLMSGKFRPDPTSNWTRLLNYISRACSQASLMKSKSSGFSLAQLTTSDNVDTSEFPDYKDRKQTPQSVALLFSLSFVAMKVILVRGCKSFDKLKGSWVQVAFFIKTALVFGETLKFLKPKSGKSIPHNITSPSASNIPLTPGGALSPGLANWTGGNSNDARTAAFSFSAPLSTGTIYDFTTWRFLEFVTCFKSPLLLFLKDFIQEKLIDMGEGSSIKPSIYSPLPSPGVGFPFGAGAYPLSPSRKEGSVTRWRSWGGGSPPLRNQRHSPSATTQHGIIPQLNIQDADSLSITTLNITTDTPSLSNGLGLHIPGKASFSSSGNTSPRVPPIPSSPSLSIHPNLSDNESTIPTGSIQSPKFSLSFKNNKKDARPSFSTSTGTDLFTNGSAAESSSTVLHVLHAESITSIVHVQLSMGLKPTLPWMAAPSRQQLKPWNHRDAVAKLSNEWQLLLQLYAEVDLSAMAVKLQTQNMSNSNIPSTPLM